MGEFRAAADRGHAGRRPRYARAMLALLPEARDLLTAFSYIAIDDEIVDAAMSEPDRGLRLLDLRASIRSAID
jgi:hypothetical protein